MNDETKKEILKIINETYLDDIKSGICQRKCFKISADTLEVISEIALGIGVVCAFLVPLWQNLSYISGSIGTFGLVCRKLSSYTMKESKERTIETNTILKSIGTTELIDIAIDSASQEREFIIENKKNI